MLISACVERLLQHTPIVDRQMALCTAHCVFALRATWWQMVYSKGSVNFLCVLEVTVLGLCGGVGNLIYKHLWKVADLGLTFFLLLRHKDFLHQTLIHLCSPSCLEGWKSRGRYRVRRCTAFMFLVLLCNRLDESLVDSGPGKTAQVRCVRMQRPGVASSGEDRRRVLFLVDVVRRRESHSATI